MKIPNTTIEDQLLVLLSYNNLTPSEKTKIEQLIPLISSWESFYNLARFNRIIPHIYRILKQENWWQQIPDHVQDKISERATEIQQINAARLQKAKPILKRFQEAGIEFVILKGVLFAETIYQNSFYKRMNDIDILVRKKSIPNILQIFEEEGLLCIGERIGGNPEKQLKTSHHLPPFIDRELQCMFGIQWGLKSPLTPYRLDYEAIWSRVRPFSFLGLNALQMCPEDNFHHICVHLGYYKNGLRDVFDIYNLLRKYEANFDWQLLETEVKKAGTERLMYFALSLTNPLYSNPTVSELIKKMEPQTSAYYKKGVAEKTKNLHTQLRIGTSYPTEVEKAISEFNATNQFKEKSYYFWLTWKYLLFPPMEEAKKMAANLYPNARQGVWIWWTRSYRMLEYIASEISWLLLFALMFKTWYDLLQCGWTNLFFKSSKISTKEKMNTLGISEEALERIKKRIQ
ncbi:nucleotidyltransferase family protein [Aureispira sp. CCB-E]|uniref:nucleotidyltransferase domain-containing protein n=1 Tax=Aureispira sp. CCB-E TaxID=3051121 RepID=UPI002868A1B6|nr:nucleotidyltransferase family protein [Aureispira sp. CCB-E]WMX15088.1 nucleotidyltransferase family protein [Aureispira sp. CCB-E]